MTGAALLKSLDLPNRAGRRPRSRRRNEAASPIYEALGAVAGCVEMA
jgi:hypothetical protein